MSEIIPALPAIASVCRLYRALTSLLPGAILGALFLFSPPSWGQGHPPSTVPTPVELPQRVPASPNAAALERYALMPVSEASGTPTINIPLYEVRSGSLSVPLSLSYHASGVRVADVASWAGLGWSLNAGGTITRVVRGLPDEQRHGFRENYALVPPSNSLHPADSSGVPNHDYYRLNQLTQNLLDYQPDLYNYNFGGKSGSFMQGNDGVFRAFPFQPLHLAVTDSLITLTDEQGTRYFFGDLEYSSTQPRVPEQHISSWNLSRIVSADQADTISFSYERAGTSIYSISQQISILSSVSTYLQGPSSLKPSLKTPTDTYKNSIFSDAHVSSLRLVGIAFRGGRVTFDTTPGRLDVIGDVTLQALHITTPDGQDTLKSVRLFHSYFNQDLFPSLTPSADALPLLRLRLDSAVTATAGGVREPPFRFTYSPVLLPNRVTGSRDYWGYSNGPRVLSTVADTPPWLIPLTTVTSYAQKGPLTVGGGSRAVNPAYEQAGLLTDIGYPTGGQQHLVYEPNTIRQVYRIVPPAQSQSLAVQQHYEELTTLTTQFQYLGPATVGICRLYASQDSPRAGEQNPPKSTARFSIRDLTTNEPRVPNPNGGASWSLSSSQQNVQYLDSFELQPTHVYELRASAVGLAVGTLSITYRDPTVTYGTRNALVGGVRIREEQLRAGAQASTSIRRYYYQLPGSTASSGLLVNEAAPLYQRTQVSRTVVDPPCDDPIEENCAPSIFDLTFTILSSNSLGELEGTDQVVSYGRVAVVDSASTGQTAGTTVSTYSFASETAPNQAPYPPKALTSWKRGNLLSQCKYTAPQNGPAQLVSRLTNTYTTLDSVTFVGLAVAIRDLVDLRALYTAGDGATPFAYLNTRQTSGWQHVTQSREYSYALGDTSVAHLRTTTYWYGNVRHCQPTLTETVLSQGSVVAQRQRTYVRLAADYDTLQVGAAPAPAVLALRQLLRQHAVAYPVEQVTVRLSATDTVVTHANLSLTRLLAPGIVAPARQLTWRAAQPQPWRGFQVSTLRAGQLLQDARYESRLVFDSYDAQRHLTQAHLHSGSPLSYLWDSRTAEPLAKATNAPVARLAVTSFEPGASGSWRYDEHLGGGAHLQAGGSHTGHWAYHLTSTGGLYRDALPAGDYDLSCWYQGTSAPLVLGAAGTPLGVLLPTGPAIGTWQQARARLHLNAADNLQVGPPGNRPDVLLDDVVLRPVGAQVSTYTYDWLRGMTSQTDPTGRTVTYEYDALGRLVRTRDEQGRILSQQQYHYAGQ